MLSTSCKENLPCKLQWEMLYYLTRFYLVIHPPVFAQLELLEHFAVLLDLVVIAQDLPGVKQLLIYKVGK